MSVVFEDMRILVRIRMTVFRGDIIGEADRAANGRERRTHSIMESYVVWADLVCQGSCNGRMVDLRVWALWW